MLKCQRCGIKLSNCQGGDRLKINDDMGIRCFSCGSFHNWHDGKLLRTGGEKK